MEDMTSNSAGKVWKNVTEIHTTPKTWEKWIPIVQEKYGETQTIHNYGFSRYFACSRNYAMSKT